MGGLAAVAMPTGFYRYAYCMATPCLGPSAASRMPTRLFVSTYPIARSLLAARLSFLYSPAKPPFPLGAAPVIIFHSFI